MIATLFVSLALALLLTPLLANLLMPARTGKPERKTAFDRVAAGYARVLNLCLRRRSVVLLALIPIAALAAFLYTHLETGFFPEFDEGAFVIDYLMPPGTSLAETDRVADSVEKRLAQTPEVASWSRLTGAQSGSGLELTEQNQGDILVRLKGDRTRTADQVIDDLRDRLGSAEPAMQLDFAQILQDGIGDIAGSPSPIEVKVYGSDTNTLSDLAEKIEDILGKTRGVVDAESQVVQSGPEMLVKVDPERASRYGLSTDSITSDAEAALSGTVATTIQPGAAAAGPGAFASDQPVDVRVRAMLPPESYDTAQLAQMPIAAPSLPGGGTVPLGAVAEISVRAGVPQITRENSLQMASVDARLENRDLGSATREIQQRVARELTLPPGYRVEYGGLYASQQQSFAELSEVLGLAVLLVSTLLLVQFRSVRQSVALLVTAVLSLFGVLLGLFVTHTPLNISSFTGAIMIVGIVTENGIVLFDFFNHLRKDHPDRDSLDLMVQAGRMRLRPILMTTIGAILALFPLALGIGAGAAMQKPLAVAVIGGLSVSTFFTLIVAPALYLAMAGRQRRRAAP
jgi:multidrug efflux pump subunit AcrB